MADSGWKTVNGETVYQPGQAKARADLLADLDALHGGEKTDSLNDLMDAIVYATVRRTLAGLVEVAERCDGRVPVSALEAGLRQVDIEQHGRVDR